jgi:glycolate oxidase FAD binding subunit
MSRPAQASLTRLGEIVGEAHVLTDAAALAARSVDQLRPAAVVLPAEAAEITEIIRFAAAEKLALVPCGGCTKLGIGVPPERYDVALDLSRMNRVLAYDPQDLTLGVEPGVCVADLLRTLREQKQFLPLTVPFAARATVGGVTAANSSSPLRHDYGGIRDFCLGMEFVTGEGVASKSGGRVVKNVTGYDLHKLLIGSLGTLAVITRVNFRTSPVLPVQQTFVAAFSGAELAFGFCRSVAESVLTPQIVEVLDPGAARLAAGAEPPARLEPQSWSVVIAAAGKAAVVDRYARELTRMASAAQVSGFDSLSDAEQAAVLDAVREFPQLALKAAPSAVIFRIGVLPSAMAPLLSRLRETASQNGLDFAFLTRASGEVYAALLPKQSDAASSATLAKAASEIFGVCGRPDIAAQATLEWGPPDVKRAVGGIWGPPRQDFELMRRIKVVFDPQAVLSPGRLGGGI